jgi:hypothetical protein
VSDNNLVALPQLDVAGLQPLERLSRSVSARQSPSALSASESDLDHAISVLVECIAESQG